MEIDWNGYIRDIVDLGSESYESRVTKTAIKVGCVALFVIVVWKLLR